MTKKIIKQLSSQHFEKILFNRIYEAALLIEQLEDAGRLVPTNGHHVAQDIANYAVKQLKERWKKNA